MSNYINIKDDRLWDILFDEACVEGKQAERIQKELEKITVDEKEIIRKTFEKVIERLEEESTCYESFGETVLCIPEHIAIDIVKEEGGINE